MKRSKRDLRPHILDERITELEQTVRRLEEINLSGFLTHNEEVALRLVVQGFQNKQIADVIKRRRSTVDNLLRSLHFKLGTGGDRTRLIRMAIARGISYELDNPVVIRDRVEEVEEISELKRDGERANQSS